MNSFYDGCDPEIKRSAGSMRTFSPMVVMVSG